MKWSLLKKKTLNALSHSVNCYYGKSLASLSSTHLGVEALSKPFTIKYLCCIFDTARQSYYDYTKRQSKLALEEELIIEMVQEQKRVLPNCGVRKMQYLISEKLLQLGIKCGRDRLFDIQRQAGLLVHRKRSKTKTTNSNHPFRSYDNLLKDKDIYISFQAFVCDITYIETLEGFLYLALVTDVYSRKIVGFDLSDSLELEGCKRALNIALKEFKKYYPKDFVKKHQVIHHSDHGSEYCSYAYTDLLKQNGINISMGEIGNCFENALAESINGVLKVEFYLNQCFKTKELAQQTVKSAIKTYNQIRPHGKLKMLNPDKFFLQNVLKEHTNLNP